MYESFFDLREKPFTLQPDPGFLYLSRRHRTAATLLQYSIVSRSSFAVITGEIGSGKTTLLRYLLTRLDRDASVGMITNTHRTLGGLLQWVCLAFGLPYEGKQEIALYQQFTDFLVDQYAMGKRAILIIDEAHNLDSASLEELRVLSNLNVDKDQVLQMILSGQPELRQMLLRPNLEQLSQRVSVAYHLDPLTAEESDAYIRHRLKLAGGNPNIFHAGAIRFIFHQTAGIPRKINKLCDMALVYAFAEQKRIVDVKLVFDVVREQVQSGLPFYQMREEDEDDVARVASVPAPESGQPMRSLYVTGKH